VTNDALWGPMQSRSRVVRIVLVVVALLGTAAGLMWWESGRPGQLRIVATPPNTVVQIGEHRADGTLDVLLSPGRYTVHMRAPGYLPLDLEVQVMARTELELRPKLLRSTSRAVSP
jgi:hypothetical protein